MHGVVLAGLITIVFFSVRGAISLAIIIWGGTKIKKYFDKKRELKTGNNPKQKRKY